MAMKYFRQLILTALLLICGCKAIDVKSVVQPARRLFDVIDPDSATIIVIVVFFLVSLGLIVIGARITVWAYELISGREIPINL